MKMSEDSGRRLLDKTIICRRRIFLKAIIHILNSKRQIFSPCHVIIKSETGDEMLLENSNLSSLTTKSHASYTKQRDTLKNFPEMEVNKTDLDIRRR